MTRRRVLVVDDDPLIREVVATVLDLEEFEVVLAEDGAAGLRELDEQQFQAAVVDQMMPGLTGLELLATIRGRDDAVAELPVVLLTAVDADSLPADPIEAGAQAYLTKPFSPLHLIEVLELHIGGR